VTISERTPVLIQVFAYCGGTFIEKFLTLDAAKIAADRWNFRDDWLAEVRVDGRVVYDWSGEAK